MAHRLAPGDETGVVLAYRGVLEVGLQLGEAPKLRKTRCLRQIEMPGAMGTNHAAQSRT